MWSCLRNESGRGIGERVEGKMGWGGKIKTSFPSQLEFGIWEFGNAAEFLQVDSRLEYPEFWEQSQNPGMLRTGRDFLIPFQHRRLLQPGLEHSRDGEVPWEFPKFLWELCQALTSLLGKIPLIRF